MWFEEPAFPQTEVVLLGAECVVSEPELIRFHLSRVKTKKFGNTLLCEGYLDSELGNDLWFPAWQGVKPDRVRRVRVEKLPAKHCVTNGLGAINLTS